MDIVTQLLFLDTLRVTFGKGTKRQLEKEKEKGEEKEKEKEDMEYLMTTRSSTSKKQKM